MKSKLYLKILFAFLICFNCFEIEANNEIQLTIIIKNLTTKKFSKGKLNIIKPNESIQHSKGIVLSQVNSQISLQKGTYLFSFKSDNFKSELYYPKRISKKNNKITIVLTEFNPIKDKNPNIIFAKSIDDINTLKGESRIQFYFFGINSNLSKEMLDFKKKYNISFKHLTYVTGPVTLDNIKTHNRLLAKYLNNELKSDSWKNDLKFSIYGLILKNKLEKPKQQL